MVRPKTPCFHCIKREPACQSKCILFIEFTKQYKEYKGIVDNARQREQNIDKFKVERVSWTKKQMERRL